MDTPTAPKILVFAGSARAASFNVKLAALAAAELDGYRLFKSLGCVSCHQGVNVGGNLFERHGIFRPLASPKPEIVRVPSLRNVATTAPYFHDGSVPTLGEAVRKMAAAQLDQMLTEAQVDAIVAGRCSPREALLSLMDRPSRPEWDEVPRHDAPH